MPKIDGYGGANRPTNFSLYSVIFSSACGKYEGRSKSFEPIPFKLKVDKWATLFFNIAHSVQFVTISLRSFAVPLN